MYHDDLHELCEEYRKTRSIGRKSALARQIKKVVRQTGEYPKPE